MTRTSLYLAVACLLGSASACSSSSPGTGGTGGAGSGGSTGSGGTTGSGGAGTGGAGTGGAGTGGAVVDAPVDTPADVPAADGGDAGKTVMTFFITSTGSGAMGGNLGGLAGADAKCQSLATAVGAGGRTWKAYLSTSTVNARTRIGTGPWANQKGVMIATNLDALHTPAMNMINLANGLDEKGMMVPVANPNEHDILTGSNADGMAMGTATCMDWMSNAAAGVTGQVGHFNRMGGGGANGMSWNSAHATPSCAQAAIASVGGAGRFYCFAID